MAAAPLKGPLARVKPKNDKYNTVKVVRAKNTTKKAPKLRKESTRADLQTMLQELSKPKEEGGITTLRNGVKLPRDTDINEWVALNTIDFYHSMNMVWDLVADDCKKLCKKKMDASEDTIYLWAEEKHGKMKKPTNLSASKYVKKLQEWIWDQFEDESIFPTDGEYPMNFLEIAGHILKRMFRVYAHIYYKHLDCIRRANEEVLVMSCFEHFYFFVTEFSLVSEEDMAPMLDVIEQIKQRAAEIKAEEDAEAAAAAAAESAAKSKKPSSLQTLFASSGSQDSSGNSNPTSGLERMKSRTEVTAAAKEEPAKASPVQEGPNKEGDGA